MKRNHTFWVFFLPISALPAVLLLFVLIGQPNNTDCTTEASPTAKNSTLAEHTELSSDTTELTTEATDTSDPLIKRAEALLSEMTPYEKLCQLIILNPDTVTGVSPTLTADDSARDALEQYPVCGFSFAQQNIEDRAQTVELLAGFQRYAKCKLFFCLDEEGGTVWRVMKNSQMGTTVFGSMYSYKDEGTQTAFDNAKTIGSDIGALGFNIDFAPVADVWTNPDNTVIGKRAYSDNPEQAAELVSAAVEGFHAGGIGCTLKHFPGHGDTLADSHKSLPVLTTDLDTLRETAFLPFRAGIEAGADFVMVGHIVLKAVDGKYPASLSERVVTGLLREELGYDGVVITDALGMGALNAYSEPERCLLALQAGCDILLGVQDIDAVLSGLQAAVDNGALSMERIDESILRILHCKLKLGIIR